MAGAAAAAGVAVEVLVEGNQIAPVGIVVEQRTGTEDQPIAPFVAQEDAREPPR